jgi:iron-sulfur cluster repair protein YtfE (RIC family)
MRENDVIDARDGSLLAELRWVHDHLRRDLETCRALSGRVVAGAPAESVRADVEQLQVRGPLFQLKVSCLRYCQLVHGHHGLEDAMLFPAIRFKAPALGPDVDRLESDHRTVSVLLDLVEQQTYLVEDGPDPTARQALSDALTDLADVLLEHLTREETVLAPVLGRATTWSELLA